MPKFVVRTERPSVPESPEALFRALRPSDAGIRHLWAHQADLLREYEALADDAADVAIELPTGAGKTLVGLLLAEYRRRALGQRVAYLCPTIQLARQAGSKADGYGIPAVVLTGPQAEYDPAAFTSYTRAQAVAITTYHGILNANPRINSAQTLVLDDAHSGEGPVADLWAITAARAEGPLYEALLAALIDTLPRPFAERMRDSALDPVRRNEVELVPPRAVAARADVLREAVTAHARDHNLFSGRMIADAAGHCLVYVSWNEILIRPLVPLTAEHQPFAGAEQRIYMSATLGAGGELERAFGVPRIRRLEVPAGWDEHGSGRRFFLFPGAAQEPASADTFIQGAILLADRVLVLAPSNAELERFAAACLPQEIPRIYARDVEDDFSAFTARERAGLLLANRYDGIDLPDESCRLIVLTGLPAATHLQERFLYEKLKATRVLGERIRTRLVQGAGRCTRNAQDFAAVVVRGERLVDFCSRDENLRAVHPELQAEFGFGLDNCEERDVDLLDLLRSFLAQDEEWRAAESDVRARAAEARREFPAGAAELQEAAKGEVECWQALWRGDLRRAIALAQDVADGLVGPELRSYRGLWLYLGASWATELAEVSSDEADAHWADTLRGEAEGCARTMSWVPRIEPMAAAPPTGAEYDERAERAAEKLKELGVRGLAFERKLAEIVRRLDGGRGDTVRDRPDGDWPDAGVRSGSAGWAGPAGQRLARGGRALAPVRGEDRGAGRESGLRG